MPESTERTHGRLRWSPVAGAWLLLCALVPASTALFVWRGYFEGPFLEMWFEVRTLAQFETGGLLWRGLFRMNREHLALPARFFIFAEYLYFRGRNIFLLVTLFIVQGTTALALVRLVLRDERGRRVAAVFLAGLALIAMFSAQQMENFLSPWQLPFIMAPCAGAWSFVWFIDHCEGRAAGSASRGTLVASLLAATVATWSLASGMVTWALLLCLARPHRQFRREIAALLTCGGVAVGIYAAALLLNPGDYGGVQLPAEPQPGYVAQALVLFLGLPVRSASAGLCAAVGVTGIGLGLYFVAICVTRLPQLDPTRRGATVIAVSCFSVALAVAVAPGAGNVGAAGASRYVTFAMLFWWAALAYLLSGRPHGSATRGRQWAFCLVIAVFLGGTLLPGHLRIGRHVAETARLKRRAGLALLVGVPDPLLRVLFQHPDLWSTAEFLRRRQLSLYAPQWTHGLGRSVEQVFRLTPTREGVGAVVGIQAVPSFYPDGPPLSATSGVVVNGWAWDAARQRPPSLILLVDHRNVIRGFGRCDGLPTDAQAAARRVDWDDRPWFGWTILDQGGVIRPFGIARYLAAHALGPPEPEPQWSRTWFGYAKTEEPTVLRAFAVDVASGTATPLAGARAVGSPTRAAPVPPH